MKFEEAVAQANIARAQLETVMYFIRAILRRFEYEKQRGLQ